MKRLLLLWLGLITWALAFAQSEGPPPPPRWEVSVQAGQYPASLITPRFGALRPGVGVNMLRRWNSNPKHQLVQQATLDLVFHRQVQNALRLYTEAGYRFQADNGLQIAPLMLGGGYVLSMVQMTTLAPDENGSYQVQNFPLRHNWLISLGPDLGYRWANARAGRGLALGLSYRIQVQGTFIQQTVPMIAYAPLWLRLTLPF